MSHLILSSIKTSTAMSPWLIMALIAGYFAILMLISHFTGKGDSNSSFFIGDRQSPWYVVAFGMIGVSLSGVTYLSVPGTIAKHQFSYLQMVLGNCVGYALIAFLLLPLYYRLKLTSIYSYLGERFGPKSQKTGSLFFLLSRTIGASLRLYLVIIVLHKLIGEVWGLPFWLTVFAAITLIWVYTHKGGIKTVVWTDTLQTACMLIAMGLFIYLMLGEMDLSLNRAFEKMKGSGLSQVFFFDDWMAGSYFWRSFISGIFITLVMNGLDQDMMQKSLSCPNLNDAKKNLLSLSVVFLLTNICFLFLGGLLTLYARQKGIEVKADKLFATVAEGSGTLFFSIFLLGVIAAAYSSADSALTSLTTSFCVDFLDIEKQPIQKQQSLRRRSHIAFSLLLFMVILIFKNFNDDSIVWTLFKAAGFTYGPLLGLYAFGMLSKRRVMDSAVPFIAVCSPILCYILKLNSKDWLGFDLGLEILLINGGLSFALLWICSRKALRS